MRKYKFISTLRFLKINEKLNKPFSLIPGIDLINDKKKISKILDNEFQIIAGQIETNHFKNANNIIFCEFDESMFNSPLSSNEALITWIIWVDLLIKDSWLVKDNSISCEIAYMKMTNGIHSEWSNNSLTSSPSFSSGEKYKEIIFSYNELLEWESQSNKLQEYLHKKNSGVFDSFIDKNFSRLGRSLRFIIASRRESHPAIKIAHYCSAFESLFSTDNTELSHKLSERVALFLKNYGYDPLLVFDDIKSFYNIRSKVTHGDSLQDKRMDIIPELSIKCDDYLRFIINKILDDTKLIDIFDSKKEIQEKYFKELIFS